MKRLIFLLLVSSIAYSQVWVRTGNGMLKMGNTTTAGDSLVISATASIDSNTIATRYWVGTNVGNWTTVERSADTTLSAANITFVALGDPQFTMTASTTYEIQGRIYYVRATAANGVTLAMNAGGSPTNIGLVFSAVDNATDGTDQIKTATVNTATDSLQLVNTTVTSRQYIDIQGTITCDGSNRLFGLRWHLEVASSGVTISRGSYIRYRKLY